MFYFRTHSIHFIYGYMEERNEMLYLTTHSTHFIYGYNGVRHVIKDHIYGERRNPLPPHGLIFPISSNFPLCMHHPEDRIAYTTTFVTPVVEHRVEREIAHGVRHEGSTQRPIAP